ncbi:PREDICTED: homeobox-DDT domain protein RLT3-like [Tarenaya hassleriana]|uniref:homeobox-DDT domain protein RLT3-like n=1 Tax=Tarenaya hassleriana TaxID=28532 RepID=UPI00053C5755|nr:PREDICTED: homeobox-DDT domain protein RLT3-like [Tarenaya hassleriana]
MRKKSPVQLQALEDFYLEKKYPTAKEIKDYSKSLRLTVKEVRGWFIEKRRRDKRRDGCVMPSASTSAVETSNKRKDPGSYDISNMSSSTSSRCTCGSSGVEKRSSTGENTASIQKLLAPQYILAKIFRKDGPPLGVGFDSLPSRTRKASWLVPADQIQQKQRVARKRKISELMNHHNRDCIEENATRAKHGIGKGLMTVWRAMNPTGVIPPGIDIPEERITLHQRPSRKSQPQKKKQRQLASILKQKMLQKSSREKKCSINREVELHKDKTRVACKENCELSLDEEVSEENQEKFAILLDDEELEMRELQAGANPLTCSGHHPSSGLHVCFLCKDLLPKFPPNSVKMKLPFGMHPWDSSPESVKKLFKVLHFLYTYSVALDMHYFTLEEFVKAFHDKDSLLLGKIHLSLLKLLVLDLETELQRGTFTNLSISCKFLALLHSVESQILILDLWKDSLSPLTWTEILRQILVAAGFGSAKGAVRREELSKERRLLIKHGLCLGTLKGELFRLLFEQGNNGLKVSDLANSAQVAQLNLATSSEELERSISATLASDITLFEKISGSAYRLRASCFSEDPEKSQSDSDDFGSVDEPEDDSSSSSGDDSENLALSKIRHRSRQKRKNKILDVNTEIDESHPGEPWLLGLMEGDYSDLSIEEKLDVLVALIDILSSGSTVRMEESAKTNVDCVPSIYTRGSGGKIKRGSSNQHNYPRESWVHGWQLHSSKGESISDSRPIDSSTVAGAFAKQTGDKADGHPMQSVYLGSDRRFNRYWLFLGPCHTNDPGHRSVYFESSEDGHWKVIDNEEVLRALLSILDDRGTREANLIGSLEKREAFLCQAMSSRQMTQSDTSRFTDVVREDSSSPVSDIDNNLCLTEVANNHLSSPRGAIVFEVESKREQKLRWIRVQEFDDWIWASFYSNLNAVKYSRRSYLDSLTRCKICHDLYWRDEKHCKICHATFELDIDLEERYAVHAATCRKKGEDDSFPEHKVLPPQLQSLKAAVHAIESAMPEEALIGAWRKSARRLWVKRLRRTSSLSELLQVIGNFVGAINVDWLWRYDDDGDDDDGHSHPVMEEIITCFPSIPQTSSAVALWLVKLDSLTASYLEKLQPESNQERRTRSTSKRASKL